MCWLLEKGGGKKDICFLCKLYPVTGGLPKTLSRSKIYSSVTISMSHICVPQRVISVRHPWLPVNTANTPHPANRGKMARQSGPAFFGTQRQAVVTPRVISTAASIQNHTPLYSTRRIRFPRPGCLTWFDRVQFGSNVGNNLPD